MKTIYPPIFIIGTPRSGTTLTARILGHHSNIFMPGETHFFDDIYSRRKELGYNFNQECIKKVWNRLYTLYGRYNEPIDQKRIEDMFKNYPSSFFLSKWNNYKDVLDSFMYLQTQKLQKNRWGNHTPRDIFNIDHILSFYPNAKIIVCVRDIRDYLLSYKGKWKVTSPEDETRLKKIYHPVVTSFIWKASMKMLSIIKKKVPDNNLCIIKYEDLVHYPENIVQKICNTIDEKFEPEMLNVNSYASSHEKFQKGIYSSSIGLWKSQLSFDEAFLGQFIASSELHRLDYKIEKLKINHLKVSYLILTTPFALWKGLQANKNIRGPLLPYLAKRLLSSSK